MFDTIRRSYLLFRQSLAILSQDKELLLFPFLSGIITILAFASLVWGGWTTGFFTRLVESGDRSLEANALAYGAMFVWYFVSWFIVLFFNVAIVHCARMRLDGGDPTIADGFRASMQHLGRITAWAAVSATVGVLLRFIADRSALLGKFVVWLVGAAWAIATYFIVPVLIFERRSLKDSLKQSTGLIAKTWGESLAAGIGLGAFTMLLAIAGMVVPVIGAFIGVRALIVGLVLMVAWWIVLAVLTSALASIFRTCLYMYATSGTAPQGFSPEFVQNAFAPKGRMTRAIA